MLCDILYYIGQGGKRAFFMSKSNLFGMILARLFEKITISTSRCHPNQQKYPWGLAKSGRKSPTGYNENKTETSSTINVV